MMTLQARKDRIAFANEERDRAQRRTIDEISTLNVAYSRFVPRAFLDLLGKDDVRDVRLGDGIEREMTVLFSDVRSFTTISESLSPNETFGFINGLLSATGPVEGYNPRPLSAPATSSSTAGSSTSTSAMRSWRSFRRTPTTRCGRQSACKKP